ncbi:MAG: DUF1501 domain-containing protein [Planctomycetes bacterium]|nr:DUF1501 domain-containing protein [Planctomycetota bacterium]
MIRFVANEKSKRGQITRREWLRIGGIAGLGLPGLLTHGQSTAKTASNAFPGFGRARSVIFVFASGGQSQFETWDPKPDAPLDVRGEFKAISTATPGVNICEHMPRVARVIDRLTIIRSMSHEDLDHGSAAYLALTGRYHQRRSSNPPPSSNDLPTYGAVLKRVRPTKRFVYDAVHLNGPALVPTIPAPGQNGGILGREYEPLVLGDVARQSIAIPGLDPQIGVPTVRLDGRRRLKEAIEKHSRTLGNNRRALDMDHLYRQSYEMLSSPRFHDAFDLGAEPPKLRDRYGRHRSGQACLLARRLVEAGVPLITVIWNHSNRGQDLTPNDTDQYGWDTHNDIFHAMKVHLLPRFDASFSALIEDLDERGLLNETLVVCMGEFGRAPRVALERNFAGKSPGRKHWASVYSIVMAGAGVQRGAVVGASDRLGASPVTERYGPWDVAATMFSALGIDPTSHYDDSLQRPMPITIGRPIAPIYG